MTEIPKLVSAGRIFDVARGGGKLQDYVYLEDVVARDKALADKLEDVADEYDIRHVFELQEVIRMLRGEST